MRFEGESEAPDRSRPARVERPVPARDQPRPARPAGVVSLVGPPLLVVVALVWLPAAYGVAIKDALLFVAFEVGYAIVPGVLVFSALSSRPGGWLRRLALGWGLGHVLQLLAFMVTAAADLRIAFALYPLVVGVPAAMQLRRRRAEPRPADERVPADARWLIGAVAVVAAAYVALTYFPLTPLPGGESVHYHQDYPWAIALAADAMHRWPIGDPNVAGLSMPYHWFVHVHLAAAGQVTDVPLPVIFFRLYTLPLIVLTVLQLAAAGQSLLRSAYAGLIAAGLALVVGQVNLTHDALLGLDFLAVVPSYLYTSPSVPFGFIMLLPLVILVGEAISSPRERTKLGDWILVALFMVGASDAKVVILPMIGASLGLYGAVRLLTRRRLGTAVPIAAALSAAVFGGLYLLQYRGHSTGLVLDLEGANRLFNERMPAILVTRSYLEDGLASVPGGLGLLAVGGVFLGAFGLLGAQLIGVPWVLVRQRLRVTKVQAWLLAVLGTGVTAALVTDSPGTGNSLYFLAYGVLVGCVLSADGILRAWRTRPVADAAAVRLVVLIGIVVLVAAMVIPGRLRSPSEPDGFALNVLWAYVGAAVGLALLVLVAARWRGLGGWIAVPVVAGVVLTAGILDRPVELAKAGVRQPEHVEGFRALTPEMYRALVWIRDHTPSDTVIAVNNSEALEFSYAAFSERRTFLGGWAYSLPVRETGYESVKHGFVTGFAGDAGSELFAPRVRLTERTFRDVDPAAIEELQREHGVRYLVVDEVNGFPADLERLLEVGDPVFAETGVTVLDLVPS